MRIKFDKDPLVVEQNNYATKIVNAYIVYDLDAWPNNPLNNFKLKSCLFGATNTVKSSDQEKWVFNAFVIAFVRARSCNFCNENYKNNFLVLGLHYNGDNIYLFVNGIEIFKFKVDNKNFNFPTQFFLGSIPNGFGATDSREVFLKGKFLQFFSRLQCY